MGKTAIVLGPTGIEMVNQLLPRLAIKTIEVLIGKSPQQQFRLIEPTGMRRGIHGPQARMGNEVGFRMVVNMRPTVVHNQMKTPRASVVAVHLSHAPQKMVMVVFVQTPPPHRAVADVEGHQKRDRPMPLILKLTPLNLARLHKLTGHCSRQGLDVGFLVQTDHLFPTLVEPSHALIAPQHLGRQGCKLFINGGGLPIAAAMRLETRLRQDLRHGRVVDRVYDPLLHNDLLQTAAVPMGQMQPVGGRLGTGDPLDLHPLQRGKKPPGARCAPHPRSRRPCGAGSAATHARRPCGSLPASALSLRYVPRGLRPTEYGFASPRAEAGGHPLQSRSNSVDRPPSVYT